MKKMTIKAEPDSAISSLEELDFQKPFVSYRRRLWWDFTSITDIMAIVIILSMLVYFLAKANDIQKLELPGLMIIAICLAFAAHWYITCYQPAQTYISSINTNEGQITLSYHSRDLPLESTALNIKYMRLWQRTIGRGGPYLLKIKLPYKGNMGDYYTAFTLRESRYWKQTEIRQVYDFLQQRKKEIRAKDLSAASGSAVS
jgi:hypothetical protein